MMLPADEPMNTNAETDLRFVSPAVFCADQEYIRGAVQWLAMVYRKHG